LVIVTGDHGESMLEDGFFAHPSRLSDAQTQTPLVLVGPGAPSATMGYPTSHVDVLPSVLHLTCGRPIRLDGAHGDSMFDQSRAQETLLVQGAFVGAVHSQWSEVLLFDGPARLRLLLNRDLPNVKPLGFLDPYARSIAAPPNCAQNVDAATALLKRLGR
jgi:hypothetical protein